MIQSDDVLQAQRRLRGSLLDDRCALPWRPAREFAAQMLLYVEDPLQCWRVGVECLRELLDADRVDGGFAQPGQALYAPLVESLRPDRAVPSVVGAKMDARDSSLAEVWSSHDVVVFDDVASDGRFGPAMRAQLSSIGTRTKLSMALHDGARPLGLLCADWMEPRSRWHSEACEHLPLLARSVLSPVLTAARSLARAHVDSSAHTAVAGLTPAELKVARMAATGMSYKEIARELGRSFSTVDHQLRSVRDKLGVSSTARLARALAVSPHH
ncbi:LuxR C-terminal-related transcriptional regulator [Variovorax sp. YR216]|uniref:LuxR C-terminal-related transcriptional regulator n=1 Tax=Variovorax sp. YR216 TaxID=1882828 RepID=UPI00089CDF23|nr:LuxR C-terminal-related transcriptional regulator [Variovorax sp. YR216]SEB06027.1 DNA-binding response regulator, NarL/FixJ family, contains REC and HTH domains [Variovorax sp. YR216]